MTTSVQPPTSVRSTRTVARAAKPVVYASVTKWAWWSVVSFYLMSHLQWWLVFENSIDIVLFLIFPFFFFFKHKIAGARRERFGYRGSRHRRTAQMRDGSARLVAVRGHAPLHLSLSPPDPRVPAESGFSGLSPDQLVRCILEAEPPQIYLRQQMKKPYTESTVMMSLTQLADKELVLMISWAKKIPGLCACVYMCVKI